MRSRHGLKALGLCALVLGVMTIGASSAQAAPEWMVNNTNIGVTLEPSVGSNLENNDGFLLARIGTSDMQLLCTAMVLVNVKLKSGGVTSTTSKARFTGCSALVASLDPPGTYTGITIPTPCEPHSSGKPNGTIETRELSGKLELHKGSKPVVLLLPLNAEMEFVNIEMGEECFFGENIPVYGTFTVEDCANKAEVEEEQHLIQEFATLTSLRVINPSTGPTATMDGSAFTFLTGAHVNKKWSGLAE